MARRSFDSVTRYSLVEVPPKSLRSDHRQEQFADEGTLILAPGHPDLAPISVAPPSSLAPSMLPPAPPSSVRPPMPSVRPSMPSWDDRVWSLPASERTGTTHPDALAKAKMSARDRSASAMLMIAAAAMLAALASVGFMKKADRAAAEPTVAAAVADPIPSTVAPPVAAPIAAPVPPPVTIDMDDVKPSTAAPTRPVLATPTPTPTPTPKSNVAPAEPAERTAPAKAAKADAQPKNAAPGNAQQKKALEDLLEQLGEEQLKR